MTIKVGLVGYGLAGSAFHAPIIKAVKGLQLAAIVSSRKSLIHQSYPEVEVLSTIEELLIKQDVDLIVIATPTDTHYPLAKAALQANKHVVIDKPFVVDSEQAKELINLATQRNRLLAVYQNRRWDNDFLTVQQLLVKQTLGKLYYFESHFDRFNPEVDAKRWREQAKPGSGLLYDLGAHLIDQALLLFGKPDWVYADVVKQRPTAVVDDYFHIIMAYGALRTVLHTSSIANAAAPRFTLHGDRGSFVKSGLDPQEAMLRDGKNPLDDKQWGQEEPQYKGTLVLGETMKRIDSQTGDYRQFYKYVYASIIQGDAFPITYQQIIDVIVMIETLQRSAARHCAIAI